MHYLVSFLLNAPLPSVSQASTISWAVGGWDSSYSCKAFLISFFFISFPPSAKWCLIYCLLFSFQSSSKPDPSTHASASSSLSPPLSSVSQYSRTSDAVGNPLSSSSMAILIYNSFKPLPSLSKRSYAWLTSLWLTVSSSGSYSSTHLWASALESKPFLS